jgi:ribosomal subunit interface protein
MQYTLSLVHIDLSDADRQEMDEKLDRMKRHLVPPFTMDVRLTRSVHHKTGDVVNAHVTIQMGGHVFHTERSAGNVIGAIDDVVGALKNELEKAHNKRKDHTQGVEMPELPEV